MRRRRSRRVADECAKYVVVMVVVPPCPDVNQHKGEKLPVGVKNRAVHTLLQQYDTPTQAYHSAMKKDQHVLLWPSPNLEERNAEGRRLEEDRHRRDANILNYTSL